MNIAVLCHPTAGGSGVVAAELAMAMASIGHTVHVIATQLPFRLSAARFARLTPDPAGLEGPGGLFFHQVETAHYPLFETPLTQLATANLLAEVIEIHEIDLVHAHYAIPHATSALLAREIVGRGKVVTTLHGTDVTLVGLEESFRRSTRYAIAASDAVTAVSASLAEHTREAIGVQRTIDVIHNWVDPDRFRPSSDPAYRARFARGDEKILLHISNLRPVKRPRDVIEVFARVAERVKARLLMVGDGPERSHCLEIARARGVADRVHFLGSLPSVENVLAVADVFLLPSAQESFGLAALEAMACAVPVVASRVGGLPEVVLDGQTGFLCELGDVEMMAEITAQLLADAEWCRSLGEAARARAVANFRPGVLLPKYLELYQRVLAL